MKPCVAICFYGPFRPNHRMILRGMIRCLFSPLYRQVECKYFLHTVMDENALAGLTMMRTDFPFVEVVLTQDDPDIKKVMTLMDRYDKTFRLVLCIRLDMFCTAPLSSSEIDLMLRHHSIEKTVFIPESPMTGFIAGAPDVLRTFTANRQIRCHRLGIVTLRVLADGSIPAQDRKRCPYLDDLLMDHSIL